MESVTVGNVGEKTYAFVGLERVGGVMVYDITDPEQSSFVNYINSRDFSQNIAGDDSPEGLSFIPAADSANGSAYLLASCEVSGTVAAYRLTEGTAQEPDGEGPGGHPGGENPDDAQKPGGSEDPAGGNSGGNNGASDPGSQADAGKDAPETGDRPGAGVYGAASVLAAAAACMTGTAIRRRKSER